ncbi:MAG: hypothetical protein R3Y09_09205 [Clostridia bacterium]
MKNLILTGVVLFISSAMLFVGNILRDPLVYITFAKMGISGNIKFTSMTFGIYLLSAICLISGVISTIIGIHTNR